MYRIHKSENKVKFEEEILVITKNAKNMGLIELVKQAEREEGLSLAKKILKLHQSGKPAKEIAKKLEVPLKTVKDLIKLF